MRMSKTQCARCNRFLATSNTNPDGLCGYCQREIGSHHNGAAFQEWLARGRKREIRRGRSGRPLAALAGVIDPPPLALVPSSTDAPLTAVPIDVLLAELERRRDEAAKILRAWPAAPVTH